MTDGDDAENRSDGEWGDASPLDGDGDDDAVAASPRRQLRATAVASKRARKKRKATYYVRKEEKEMLVNEVARLEARLLELEMETERKTGVVPRRVKAQLRASLDLNALLHEGIRSSDLALAGAQSLVLRQQMDRDRNPLETYLHLPTSPQQRRNILLSLCPHKLRTATSFILERIRHLDLRRSVLQNDEMEMPNGDYVVVGFDVTPFPGVTDVKVVHDMMEQFLKAQEIFVSESLGVVSVLENETEYTVQSSASQVRFLTCLAPGVEVEHNLAMFTEFCDSSPLLDRPHSVSVVDYVNEDDLYPYVPSERLREDVTGVNLILQSAPSTEYPAQPPDIALARWVFIRLHKPRCLVTPEMAQVAKDAIIQWGKVMPRVLRERLLRR
ncbi:hypothetical protein PINS_up019693 [Pythium insidiosum]|nr:hypothetical protein PINS_up019693 [Pythium insidiosum]